VTDLEKKLTQKMKCNENSVNLAEVTELNCSKKAEINNELKNKHGECYSEITTLRSDVNVVEIKLKEISEDYKNLKLEIVKLDNKVNKIVATNLFTIYTTAVK
jgi:Mg2+ and Co2+ transporter CorA